MASQQGGSGAIPKTSRQTVDDMIAAVMSMGFELQDAQDAMQCGKISTQEAVEWILAGKPGYATSGPQPPTRKLGYERSDGNEQRCDRSDGNIIHITQGPAVECAPPCSTSGSPGNQAVSPASPLMARSQESEDQVLRLSDHEREFLNAWFPHLESESYIIPPAHIDTVHERMVYIGEGERIQVLKTQQQIDIDKSREVRDTVCIDRVLKNVHHCMNQIKNEAARETDIMVILTQAKFGVYGANTQSIYTGAAARNTNSVKAEPLNLKEDFVDLLVIHRERGIMMAAIIPQTEDDPLALQEELKKAAAYLKQARDVVRRSVLGDLVTQPALHQAIVLPDTTRRCLEEVLLNMSDLQELQEGPSVEPGRNVSQICLCEDDMADQTRLDAWWRASFERNEGGDPAMDAATYTQLVARFSIPLTTVELFLSRQPRLQLWTQGHLVNAVGMEHGRPMSCIALFPQQFQVLEEPPDDDDVDVRILWGPTGTSKSVVLILKGHFLLRKGCGTVFVLQTSRDGAAAAYLVGHQVRETAGQGAGSVQLVNMAGVGKKKVQAWVEELCQHAQTHGRVHILADEAECDVIAEIYRALKQRHVRFTLWAAGVKLDVPADMERYVRKLTQPLRSPPAVVREVEQARDMKDGTVPAYTRPPVSAPCDGPPVLTVGHYDDDYRGDRQGHEGRYTWQCARCGELVADMLRDLRVGCDDNAPHGQGGLTYSDVFVLGKMECETYIHDDNRHSPAPFIRGLESRGVPTRKVAHNDTAAVRQLAEMTSGPTQRAAGRGRDEAVTVANENTVWGLERHVVVYLDSNVYGAGADDTGRLRSMSRSTAQVIWVKNVRK
ncbi:uncharacterized protein [Littorina saxatilis]|uniref:uncharacterized protein isoform X3 n=1 Tax=Littorina saxatilis TaxID=31220 RepID=UPI0038B6151D